MALAQPLFFTASAPLTGSHVNVSPKGLPSATFTIFSPNSAAYIDATGSGSETVSHIYENGRVTIMFCSFEASPRILRFFSWGKVVEWNNEPRFGEMVAKMGKKRVNGARAVIQLQIWKVQTSCGYGVPYLPSPSFEDVKAIETGEKKYLEMRDRESMGHWASKRIETGTLREYQKKNNAFSLDGLPGFRIAIRDSGNSVWWARMTAWVRRIGAQKEAFALGMVMGCLTLLLAQILAL
ncbi:MAG: hypothetical protein LQ338_005293 [Usnochroma carphineum]|nr:MAG: hypothetical protein LQ338_005293 [Usnochroma carphineum]